MVEVDENTVEVRPAPACADGSERVVEDASGVEKNTLHACSASLKGSLQWRFGRGMLWYGKNK